MFVQSAGFVAAHEKTASDEIAVYGVEKVEQTLLTSIRSLPRARNPWGVSGSLKKFARGSSIAGVVDT